MTDTASKVGVSLFLSILVGQGSPARAEGRAEASPPQIQVQAARMERELAAIKDAAAGIEAGRRFDGKYLVAGSQHAFTRHELTHVMQQRAGSLEETADEVLVAFEHGASPQNSALAKELRDALSALREAVDRLAASPDATSDSRLIGQLGAAHERASKACHRVSKIDSFTVKQAVKPGAGPRAPGDPPRRGPG